MSAARVPPHHDPACWGCGSNPGGIHLTHPSEEGATEYESYLQFGADHQGGPGIVHGGIVSAALDEGLGLLATWYRFPCVTGRLFVHFRRPVPINTELLIRSRLDAEHGRRVHVSGEIVDGDEILAQARGAFVHVALEHFLSTPEGRAHGESWRRRLDR